MIYDSTDLSTRDAIRHLLKTKGTATVSYISKKLGITPMGVRQHLHQLEAQGLVQVTQKRGGVGRPSYIYSLTREADEQFKRNYHELAEFLLDSLSANHGQETVDELFRKRAQQFISQHQEAFAGKSLKEKIALLAQLQDRAGYLTELGQEKDESRFVFTEHNCTIAHVAQKFNEACKYELDSFQKLLGEDAEVERVQCISSGDSCCQYIVQTDRKVSR